MDFTTVLGVDQKTLPYLKLVWPTWERHKPSLFRQSHRYPFLVFYDGVTVDEIASVMDGYAHMVKFVPWPPDGITYPRDGLTKWANPQRAKMLAGFVHAPGYHVQTPYWLKLDLDVTATGKDDWIDPGWFEGNPSIIAPGWGYTKPPDQMLRLDRWAEKHKPMFLNGTEPLNLVPQNGSDMVCHARICSWCAFFNTSFTRMCSIYAANTCGPGQLPVDSQDGYMWYCAHRGRFTIRVEKMRRHGWKLQSNYNGVKEAAEEAMK